MLHDRRFAELTNQQVLDILGLRVDVFVVEQECPYAEIDGRDDEAETRHVWIAASPSDRPEAYVRVLDDGHERRIGRVVTHPEHRGRGLAARLIDHVLASSEPPWVLDAQAHLAGWYGALGFEVVGDEFLEDGIPHVPMRRDGRVAAAGS